MVTKSVLQAENDYYCIVCRTRLGTDRHHVFGGRSNRQISERLGLVVLLCSQCHHNLHAIDYSINTRLKIFAQEKYEELGLGTREDFRKLFGKSYL